MLRHRRLLPPLLPLVGVVLLLLLSFLAPSDAAQHLLASPAFVSATVEGDWNKFEDATIGDLDDDDKTGAYLKGKAEEDRTGSIIYDIGDVVKVSKIVVYMSKWSSSKNGIAYGSGTTCAKTVSGSTVTSTSTCTPNTGRAMQYIRLTSTDEGEFKVSELDVWIDCDNTGQYFAANRCHDCPPGSYCPNESSPPSLCPAGKYGSTSRLSGSGCTGNCDAGRYGSSPGLTTSSCTGACDAGFYCPAGTTVKNVNPCPKGRYGDAPGLGSSACTGLCAAGNYGDSTGMTVSTCSGRCDAGYYCPEGTTVLNANACPPGRYGELGGMAASGCTGPCPKGRYGSASALTSPLCSGTCDAGHYGDEVGMTVSQCSGQCPAGYYCPAGSTSATANPCPAGRYGDQPGESNPDCAGACSAGYKCLAGTTAKDTEDCHTGPEKYCPGGTAPITVPDGSYSTPTTAASETRRTGLLRCEPGHYCAGGVKQACSLGRYGNADGGASTDCEHTCDLGYFCPVAAKAQTACGSANLYCPLNAVAPVPVPAGHYSTGGDATTRSAVVACEPGSYCVSGIKSTCAPGLYGASPLLETPACDGPCSSGYYCDAGSQSATQHECGSRAVYCDAGATAPVDVDPGYYAVSCLSETTCGAQSQCEAGSWCANGVKTPCAAGRWSKDIERPTACTELCKEGYYCPAGSLSATDTECGAANLFCPPGSGVAVTVTNGFFTTPVTANATTRTNQTQCGPGTYCSNGVAHPCPAGVFGSSVGQRSNSCDGPCPAGYFCPEGTVVATTHPCGAVTRYCPARSGTFSVVPVGSYTTPIDEDEALRTGVSVCEAGFMCSGDGTRQPCPAGRYNTELGVATNCTGVCDAGTICPAGSKAPENCGTAASYCPWNAALGATEKLAVPPLHYSVGGPATGIRRTGIAPCEAGHVCVNGVRLPCGDAKVYCPPLSSVPVVAPNGTFTVGSTDPAFRTGFQPCPPGSFCQDGVRTLCEAGNYGGAWNETSATCSGLCPAGYFCDVGTVNATGVPCDDPLFFCPEGQTAPVAVGTGFHSVATPEGLYDSEAVCPAGSYCVAAVRILCPAGRFGTGEGASALAQCSSCTAGEYCLKGAVRTETTVKSIFPCGDASVYCPVSSAAPVLVDVGYYSLSSQVAQEECPEGSYCLNGVQFPCPQGRFGGSTGLSAPACTGPCPPGTQCAPGTVVPKECDDGSYCEGFAAVPEPCPPGRYGAEPGLLAASNCTLCGPGTYNPSAGSSVSTDCRACPGDEGAGEGASACWPALLHVNASDPGELDPDVVIGGGLTDNDYLDFEFSKPTNQAPYTSGDVLALVNFSSPLATQYFPSWPQPHVLRITLKGTADTDRIASSIGRLRARVLQQPASSSLQGITDPTDTDNPGHSDWKAVKGTWGVARLPELIKVTAVDAGGHEGFGVNDVLVLEFRDPTNRPSLANMSTVLQFNTDAIAAMTGVWTSPRVMTVTVDAVAPGGVGPPVQAATFAGALEVTVLPGAGILSQDEESPPSNSTTTMLLGSWGEAPCSLYVSVRSATSLRVVVNGIARVTDGAQFEVEWSTSPTWGEAVVHSSGRQTMTGTVGVYDIVGLATDVPVYVRAAQTLGSLALAGQEATLGLWLEYSSDEMLAVGKTQVDCRGAACRRCGCQDAHLPRTPRWDTLFPDDAPGTGDGVTPAALQEYCRSLSPAAPVILDVVVAAVGGTLSTTGGEFFKLSGYHFGVPGASVPRVEYTNARFVFQASGCALQDDELSAPLQHVECRSAVGYGDGHAVRLYVDDQPGLLSNVTVGGVTAGRFLNYSNPIVNEFAGPAGVAPDTTRGNQTLIIIGQHFGPVAGSPLESVVASTADGYSFTAPACAVTRDHVEVTCTTPPGAGSPLSWTVTVAGLKSKVPSTSYGVPVVTAAEPSPGSPAGMDVRLLHTRGQQSIDVVGFNFGPPHLFDGGHASVQMVSQATLVTLPLACVMVDPHVRLRCETPVGSGEQYRIRVTFLDQASDTASDGSPEIAYATPAITALLLCGADCDTAVAGTIPSHGSFIRIDGSSFGTSLDDTAVTVQGGTVTEDSLRLLTAHTQIELEVVPHGDVDHISVAVGLPTWSLDRLVFHRLDVSPPEVSTAIGDEPVLSLEPGPLPNNQSFNAAALAQVAAAAGSRPLYVVSLPGTSLGNTPLTTTVTLCAAVADPECWCVVTHFTVPHRSLECRGVFRGSGPLVITAHDRVSTQPYTFVYQVRQPVVVGVATQPLTSGGAVDINGNSLFVGSSVPVVTLIDSSQPLAVYPTDPASSDAVQALVDTAGLVTAPCTTDTTASSANSLRCTVGPGAGANYWVVVKARGLYGISAALPLSSLFRYAAPVVTALTPPTGSTGGVSITLTGSSFATPGLATASVLVGTADCVITSRSHTQIVCNAPPQLGPDAGLEVSVTVAGLSTTSATTRRFVYDGPTVAAAAPAFPAAPTEGGTNVTLWGDNFGGSGQLSAYSYADNVVGAALFSHTTLWNNRTMARITLGVGYGSGLVLYLSNSQRDANTTVVVDYLDPVVDQVSLPASRPAVGGFIIFVEGSSFSAVRTVTVGGRPCAVLPDPPSISPHTFVSCLAPAGVGTSRLVVVTSLGGRSSATVNSSNPLAYMSYDAPVLTAAEAFDGAFDRVDATRQTEVVVNGANFLGDPVLDLSAVRAVTYAGLPCTVEDGGWVQDVTVGCLTTAGVAAGVHDLVVSVAGQTSAPVSLEAFCPEGFYGRPGDLCAVCPTSSSGLDVALCPGQYADPIAREGFFRLSRDTFRECVPVSACPEGAGYDLDDSGAPLTETATCGDGYKGIGCSECALKYYRLDEQCEPCPSTAWIYMLLFVVALAVMLGLAYWFNKMQLNLAGLSIGVDFAQIVAMFAAFDFAWPVALRRTLNSVSASNFNLQILAPECSVTFTYKDKWLVVQSVPLTLILCLAVIYAVTVTRDRLSRKRRASMATGGAAAADADRKLTANTVVGIFFTLLYFMYLVLTKNTLSIFDCTELEDGTKILDEDNSIICDSSDPTYALLRPLAYASLVLFVIGIPLLFVSIIYKHRASMNADQALRELNRGQTAETNPDFFTRQRYQKLYNDFRPGYCHWRLVIMVRKFGLAFVALMFSKNPMFQASFCVLIMFVAYILHAKHQPFLSSRPIPEEIREAVKSNITAKRSMRASSKKGKAGGVGGAGAGAGGGKMTGADRRKQFTSLRAHTYARLAQFADEAKEKGIVFVFDYNRLESALLICATGILVGGMVFESGSNDCYDSTVVEEGSALYVFLTVVLIVGLVTSMLSFIGILIWEMYKSIKHARMYRKGVVAKKKLSKLTENPLANKSRQRKRLTIPTPALAAATTPSSKGTPDSEMKRLAVAPMRTRGGGGGATAPAIPGQVVDNPDSAAGVG